jgi:glycerol-3-phosphate O-acyltransferase
MILSAEELHKTVKLLLKLLNELNESAETAIKELIDRKIAEAIDQHLEDYEHKEKPATEEAYLP